MSSNPFDPENDSDKDPGVDLEEPLVVGAVTPGPAPSFDPAPGSAPGAKKASPFAGFSGFAGFSVAETQKPLFVSFFSSVILLIAVGARYGWHFEDGYEGYAISIPCISLILSAVNMFLSTFSEDQYKKIGMHINLLNFLYSFVGVCFLTFRGPFTITGNGYFAAWLLVYGTGTATGMTVPAFGFNLQGTGAVMGLIVSSLVLLIASIGPIKVDYYKGEAVYAIALSCFTLVLGLVFLYCDKKSPDSIPKVANFGVLLAVAICWVPMACLATFKGPFLATSNGYFAAWAGTVKAIVAAYTASGEL